MGRRSWCRLRKINDPAALASAQAFNRANAYNGNIGTIRWQSKVPAGLGLSQQLQSYDYTYDELNRLTAASNTAIT